jgi:hypothetical protein
MPFYFYIIQYTMLGLRNSMGIAAIQGISGDKGRSPLLTEIPQIFSELQSFSST